MPNRVVWTFVAKDKFSRISQLIKRRTVVMKKEFNRLNKAVKKTSKAMKKMAGSMKMMSAAAGLAVVGSLKAFGDMEKGITNVLTLLDDKEVEKFGGKIESMATDSLTKFGFATEETTQALFNNVSALGANEQSFAAFEAAQKLAIGGVTTLDTSVSGIAAVMNAYGDSAGDATQVANAFFAAQKKGTTDVSKLASNIGAVAPIASNLGVSYQELLATMAQLTQGGLSTEEATTSLKGVLSALQRPIGTAKKMFTELGIPFGVTAVRGAGLAKTLAKIAEVSEKQPDLIAELIPNIRALTGVSSLGADQIARIQGIVESMNEDQLSPAFQKQMETFNRSTALLKGNMTALFITIGSHLAPVFLKIAGWVRMLIDYFNTWSDANKKLAAYALLAVAVLAPLVAGIAAVITVLGPGLAVIGGFMLALGGLPILIAAVVALLVVLATKFEAVRYGFSETGKWFKKILGFGDEELDVNGNAEMTNKNTFEGSMTVNAAKGTVSDVKSKSTGGNVGLNVAENMAGAS